MELTTSCVIKNTSSCTSAGYPKFIQIAPWMTAISRTGIPAELKVKRSTTRTIRIETTLTTILSISKDFLNSYWLVELPTT